MDREYAGDHTILILILLTIIRLKDMSKLLVAIGAVNPRRVSVKQNNRLDYCPLPSPEQTILLSDFDIQYTRLRRRCQGENLWRGDQDGHKSRNGGHQLLLRLERARWDLARVPLI